MRRPAAAVVVSVLLSLLVGFALTPQAGAQQWTPSSYAARLIGLLNQTRGQHGLAPLSVAAGTTEVASAWTSHMASSSTLAHNPDLQHQLETHGSPDWTTYGENVGDGPADDPDALFKAYMNSPEHRANILNGGYRFMGVAVVFGGSTAWNTFDFVDTYHASTPATHAARPKPQPTAAARPGAVPSVLRTAAPAPAKPVLTTRSSAAPPHHHTTATAQHRHHRRTTVSGRRVARQQVVAEPPTTPVGSVVAMPHVALPAPLAVPVEVAISIAAGLIGFVGVRWAQVAAGRRNRFSFG